MKASLAAAIAAAFTFILAEPASAYSLVAKPRGPGLEQREASQAANLAHVRYVCRRGRGAHRRFACAWKPILVRELAETRFAQAVKVVASIGDYAVAVRFVERYFGPQPFLWACPHSEGGFGVWVWNGRYPINRYPATAGGGGRPHGSSGAGGWLQFIHSTFESVIDDAVAHARAKGMPVPASVRDWRSPVGQALAGIEMLRDGRAGEWSGSSC